jgi:hypothetical protein
MIKLGPVEARVVLLILPALVIWPNRCIFEGVQL